MENNRQYLFVLLLFFVGDPSQQESCDVMEAVKCFATMPAVINIEHIADDPHAQVVVPCQTEVQTMEALKECLKEPITGCPSIASDVEISVNDSTKFCTSVLGDCHNNEGYHTKYSQLFQCQGTVFSNIGNFTMSREEKCTAFEECLLGVKDSCDAMENHVKKAWRTDMIHKYCSKANVTFILDTANAFTNSSTKTMRCAELAEVAMAIDGLHTVADGEWKASEKSIKNYCTIVNQFHTSVLSVLTEKKCAEFQTIFNASIAEYLLAAKVFCGSSRQEDVNDVCDIGAVKTCFSKLDMSLLKLEQILMENYITETLAEIKENAAQMTALTRDLTSFCESADAQILEVEGCIVESMGGCPGGLSDTFQYNAKYIRTLCSQLHSNNCTSNVTFNEALATCSNNALKLLNELGRNETQTDDTELTYFVAQFCGAFHGLVQCMHDVITPCTGDTEEVRALYAMIKQDVSPVCDARTFPVLSEDSVTDNNKYLECRNIIGKSQLIDSCNKHYLENLFQSPSNSEHICNSMNDWQGCLADVVDNCPHLERDLYNYVRRAREDVGGACPEPSTPSAPPPISQDKSETQDPTEEKDDGDGDENSGAYLQMSLELAIGLALLNGLFSA